MYCANCENSQADKNLIKKNYECGIDDNIQTIVVDRVINGNQFTCVLVGVILQCS